MRADTTGGKKTKPRVRRALYILIKYISQFIGGKTLNDNFKRGQDTEQNKIYAVSRLDF